MIDQAEKLRKLAEHNIISEKEQGKENDLSKAKIITVTSGKGGVGKSNFVVNIGISLSKSGKKVLILDADIGMANDDVLMGFIPKYNIHDVLFNDKKLEEVIIVGPHGVKLIAGGSGLTKIDELTEIQRESFLSKLNALEDLDYIIIDTGAGINRSVLGFISCCDDLIVIATPEPTSLTDSYSLLKVVNHFKIKNKVKVVVNRTIDSKEGINTFNKFNNAVTYFLKMDTEFLGAISEDKKLSQAVREQKPFVVNYPNCEAAEDINKIANTIIGDTSYEHSMNARGLFKKIFNIFS